MGLFSKSYFLPNLAVYKSLSIEKQNIIHLTKLNTSRIHVEIVSNYWLSLVSQKLRFPYRSLNISNPFPSPSIAGI
jgi:hypothetical protein